MKGIICPMLHGDIDEFKASSLFVDVLVPANIAQHRTSRGIYPGTKDILDEIAPLEELGLIEVNEPEKTPDFASDFFGEKFNVEKLTTYGRNRPPMGVRLFDFFDAQANDHSYLVSEYFNFLNPGSAVSLHAIPKSFSSPRDLTNSDVLSLIVNKFPVPVHQIPWTEIAALKREDEFKNKLRLLRNWMRSVVKESTPAYAILDDIKTQIYDYERYMKSAAIKCEATPIDLVLTVAPGVLEDILKLRLESLSNRFLKARRSRAHLELDELKAPGRAISIVPYIGNRLRA